MPASVIMARQLRRYTDVSSALQVLAKLLPLVIAQLKSADDAVRKKVCELK